MQVHLADRIPQTATAVVQPTLPRPEVLERELPPAPVRATASASDAPQPSASESLAQRAEPTEPRVDFTPTEIARIPSSAPRSIEPEATPSAAATPAVSGLALPQLAAASPAAPAATPQRHASRAAQAAADMPRNSVALAELANTETLERASVETLPESQGKRALAIRDAANTAQPATAAAPLALQDAGAGVPSSSSRALGSPSRPTQQRSLGALAASEASSSVAQAGPT
jgi:hypothetical protein